MKKITISLIALTMACPSFANITKENTSPTCNNDTIGATSGTTSLEAEWTANTINLDWDPKNGGEHGSSTCSYDGGISLPSNPTAPTGYAFAGWQVKVANILASLNASIDGSAYGYSRLNGNAGKNESTYGLTVGSGEWAAEFSYGTVKGIASCNNTKPSNWDEIMAGIQNETITYEQAMTMIYGTNGSGIAPDTAYSSSSTGQYCWCQPTGFDAEKDGTYVGVASSSWVFGDDAADAGDCARDCAYYCASNVYDGDDFRRAVFGVSQ